MRVSRSRLITNMLVASGAALVFASCKWGWGWGWDPEEEHWNVCGANSDCTLAASSCCGPCGEPSLDDVDAVNRDRVDRHFSDVCPHPVPCPKCATLSNPDLHATCTLDRCQAVDIRDRTVTQCEQDEDCRLRVTGCCECGGSTAPWDLIAINVAHEGDYQELTCDAGQACPECAPVYPTSVEAFCAGDGHCAVRDRPEACAELECQ